MLRIDADAHVLETEETWEFMDGADRKFRPDIVGSLNGSGEIDEYWLVDGTLRLKSRNVGKDTPLESRELRDVAVRLRHMDEIKVDIQVIFPTIFIIPLTPRPEIELALCRGYNRWMGECWKQSDNRLRWVAVVPLLSTDQVYDEARLAKENGAVGIYMRGSEGERLLSDPYFYPVYDAAEKLDIPVCIHSSNGSPVLYDYYKYETVGFSKFKLVVVGAFHTIIMDRIPERFPKLKMAFLEVGSQWVPYALSDLYKRYHMEGKEFSKKELLAREPHLDRLRDQRRPALRHRHRRRGPPGGGHRLRPRRQRHRAAGPGRRRQRPEAKPGGGRQDHWRERAGAVQPLRPAPA